MRENAGLQPGGLDQRVDEEPQLFRLPLQGGDVGPALRRQILLPQQLGVQQQVGDGGSSVWWEMSPIRVLISSFSSARFLADTVEAER